MNSFRLSYLSYSLLSNRLKRPRINLVLCSQHPNLSATIRSRNKLWGQQLARWRNRPKSPSLNHMPAWNWKRYRKLVGWARKAFDSDLAWVGFSTQRSIDGWELSELWLPDCSIYKCWLATWRRELSRKRGQDRPRPSAQPELSQLSMFHDHGTLKPYRRPSQSYK